MKKEFTSRIGFACCNLHYSGDWISDFQRWPAAVHSAGTPIVVRKIDGYRA